MSDILTISRASNGYVVQWHEDGFSQIEVIEGSETDALKDGESLLWLIMDHYGFGGSKHDAERIRIVRVKRDAPEEG
jgi:hypothetical protein